MKKIIFALFLLKSFAFGADGVDCSTLPDYYNSKTDLAVPTSNTTGTYFYGTYADIYPPELFCSPTYNSFTMFKSLSIIKVSTDWYKSTNTQYYNYIADYQCPDGQDIINGVCAVPPTCATGTIWDGTQDICVYDPNTADGDGDGTPDKCDFDYINYKISDCDGDGIPNDTDDDLDGDGIPNSNDSDSNGDNKSDPDSSCLGADVENSLLKFPFSEYKFHSLISYDSCNNLIYTSQNIDHTVSFFDKKNTCTLNYCYAHYISLTDNCRYWSSDFIPVGSNWIVSTITTESACAAAVDNIKYTAHHWAFPEPSNCPMDKWCYLQKKVETTEETTPAEEVKNPDTNTTTADLAPLLQSMNNANDKLNITNEKLTSANEKLDSVNEKLDTSNTHLTDIKDISNKSKNFLDSIAQNSMTSNSNEVSMLDKLGNMNTTLKGFSDVSTTNQLATNQLLLNNGGKTDTSNGLLAGISDKLSSIDESLSGDGTPPDVSFNDGFADLISGDSDLIDFVTTQFSTFKDNINANFTSINTQYVNAKSLFENPLSAPSFSGSYNPSCFSFNMLGKNVVLDMSYLSVISPVIYFIFTLTFMILNFRFLLNHILRGEN